MNSGTKNIMTKAQIYSETTMLRDNLKAQCDFAENPIDDSLPAVLPFYSSDNIQLIIIGQDPTVKNIISRRTIKHTLNLDKKGALHLYISEICRLLDIGFENIYATNIFKYFYTVPPERTMYVLYQHLVPNLELLKKELSCWQNAIVVSLGLPVLRLLTHEKAEVSEYWNYNKKTKKSDGNFKCCRSDSNKLGIDFYPLPHQPSIIKMFYKSHLKDYLKYVKTDCKQSNASIGKLV